MLTNPTPRASSIEQKQRILMDVVKEMKEFSAPSITQICGNFDELTGEIVGTGTFFRLRDADYLLTAQHVVGKLYEANIDGSRKYGAGLSHSIGNDQAMLNVAHPWITWKLPYDLAVTRLDPTILEVSDRIPLTVEQIALNSHTLDANDVYFIHGFPGKQSHFTALCGRGVISKSLPYGGWLESSSWTDFDDSIHFAISFPPIEIIDERGKATTLPDPHGLSGAVVWKTGIGTADSNWSPRMATVIGVVHRHDQASRSLVVTRIEYVKGLLLYKLRSDFAYFRWLERGRPLWDDLVDWVAAEQSITNLRG